MNEGDNAPEWNRRKLNFLQLIGELMEERKIGHEQAWELGKELYPVEFAGLEGSGPGALHKQSNTGEPESPLQS